MYNSNYTPISYSDFDRKSWNRKLKIRNFAVFSQNQIVLSFSSFFFSFLDLVHVHNKNGSISSKIKNKSQIECSEK